MKTILSLHLEQKEKSQRGLLDSNLLLIKCKNQKKALEKIRKYGIKQELKCSNRNYQTLNYDKLANASNKCIQRQRFFVNITRNSKNSKNNKKHNQVKIQSAKQSDPNSNTCRKFHNLKLELDQNINAEQEKMKRFNKIKARLQQRRQKLYSSIEYLNDLNLTRSSHYYYTQNSVSTSKQFYNNKTNKNKQGLKINIKQKHRYNLSLQSDKCNYQTHETQNEQNKHILFETPKLCPIKNKNRYKVMRNKKRFQVQQYYQSYKKQQEKYHQMHPKINPITFQYKQRKQANRSYLHCKEFLEKMRLDNQKNKKKHQAIDKQAEFCGWEDYDEQGTIYRTINYQ